MTVTEIISLMSGFGGLITAIGVLIANIAQNRKTAALLDYRMSQVERKLAEQSDYAKEISEIKMSIVAIQKDVSFLRQQEITHD